MKLKLGKLWEAKSGHEYRNMMVFENNPIDGAERLADVLAKIRQLRSVELTTSSNGLYMGASDTLAAAYQRARNEAEGTHDLLAPTEK